MDVNFIKMKPENIEYILNQLNEIVLVLDRERKIRYHNTSLFNLPMKFPKTILGLRIGELFNCIHINEYHENCGTSDFCKYCGANQAIVKALSNQSDTEECIITSMTGQDSTLYNFKINSSPISINNKNLILFTLTDIGDTKHGRILEETLYNLFQDMQSGVAIYEEINNGQDFIFQFFNKAAEKIDNVKQENLLGKRLTQIFPGAIDMGILNALRQVYKTGESMSFPLKFYSDNRISGWRDNYIFKLPKGEVVAIYSDVTEQKKLELKLTELSLTDELTGLKIKELLTKI